MSALALTALPANAAAPPPVEADMVVRNAKIFTSNTAKPWSETIAISKGKIVAIGSEKEVAKFVGPNSNVIDAQQRLVVPGIIDAHLHLAYAVKDRRGLNCFFEPDAGLDAILSAVEGCVKTVKPGEWIAAKAWDSGLLPVLTSAAALRRLDAITPDNPVIMRSDSIHDRWANSVALKKAGVTKDTKDPKGGKIGRDPQTGELNGLLIEIPAAELVDPISPLGDFMAGESTEQLDEQARLLLPLGVTGWNDALVTAETAQAYSELEKAGKLHARVGLSINIDPNRMKPSEFPALYKSLATIDSGHISTKFAKIFLDGTPVSKTAFVLEPYLPDVEHGSDYHGTPFVKQAVLDQAVTALDAMGVSVKMHATGNGSVREALDAIAAARKANGPKGPFHTIAHAGHIAPADVPRFRPLGAIIDASPTLWYPGSIMDAIVGTLGKERGEAFFLFRTDIRNGVTVAGGTDWKTLPAEYSDLWDGIEGMVTRRNPTGKPSGRLHPEEALDLGTVMRIYTINSAIALSIDKVAGSLEVGKSADFSILNQNIFARPPECISGTRSILTVFEGKVVYRTDRDEEPACN